MSPLPTMTAEQRAAGLEKAREVRVARAAALERLRTGTLTLADFLASEDEVLKKTKVRAMLLALPGIGPAKAGGILADVGIDPKRRVGGLGSNQRQALTERLAA
jgi:hypothetical protein